MNRVILTGFVGRDPELKYTPQGSAIANYSLATDESYKDKQGKKVDKTEWHRVTVFGRAAETVGEYVKKGTQLLVEGKLQTRSWDTDSGEKRYMTEIVQQRMEFLGKKSDNGGGNNQSQSNTSGGDQSSNYGTSSTENLPF